MVLKIKKGYKEDGYGAKVQRIVVGIYSYSTESVEGKEGGRMGCETGDLQVINIKRKAAGWPLNLDNKC